MAKDGGIVRHKGLFGLNFWNVATSRPLGLGALVCLLAVNAAVADRGSAPAAWHSSASAREATAFFTLRPVDPPVGMGQPLADFAIEANEIVLPSGGVRLWFEIQLGGWAPELLQTWQATIDSASYSNGIGADLSPAVEPCTNSTYCASVFGRRARCVAGFCVPGWQDTSRADFVIQGGISAVRTTTLEYAYGSTTAPGNEPAVDDGQTYYGGTLVIDVPREAAGSYKLRFRNDGASFQINPDQELLPITAGHMLITLPTACCLADGTCSNAPLDCQASGGVRVASCSGDCDGSGVDDRCELAQGGSDCNRNATLDACDLPWDGDGDGVVSHADYGLLFGCINPPCGSAPCDPGLAGAGTSPCCALADVDGDGDVDLRDFAELEIQLCRLCP